jgi:hypothetical protein
LLPNPENGPDPGARQFGCTPVGRADDGIPRVDHTYWPVLHKGLVESEGGKALDRLGLVVSQDYHPVLVDQISPEYLWRAVFIIVLEQIEHLLDIMIG